MAKSKWDVTVGKLTFKLNPTRVVEVYRNDIPWTPYSNMGYDTFQEWVESQLSTSGYPKPGFVVIRSVKFSNCDKAKNCPTGGCYASLTYTFLDTWKYCTACGTLIAPARYTSINPEHISYIVGSHWKNLKNFIKSKDYTVSGIDYKFNTELVSILYRRTGLRFDDVGWSTGTGLQLVPARQEEDN